MRYSGWPDKGVPFLIRPEARHTPCVLTSRAAKEVPWPSVMVARRRSTATSTMTHAGSSPEGVTAAGFHPAARRF